MRNIINIKYVFKEEIAISISVIRKDGLNDLSGLYNYNF